MNLKIQLANLSDVGKKRTANEDYYGSFEIKDLKIFIVSDGMGGYKGGSTASHIAVNTIKNYFEQNSQNIKDISEAIKEALNQADLKIKQKADEDIELKDMGATAVVLLIKNELAYTAHIGDSRIYLIRDREIKKLTKDHSLVQQMLDGGLISEELAKTHPNRNVITHSLGYGGKSDVELHQPFQLFKNDILILCTDGLTGHAEDFEIKEISLNNEPVTAVHKLIDLANERGGKDNITVQLIKILKGKRRPLNEKLKKKILYPFFYSILGLAGLVVIAIIILFFNVFNNSTEMIKNQNKVDTTIVNKQKLDNDSSKKISENDTLKEKNIDSLTIKK